MKSAYKSGTKHPWWEDVRAEEMRDQSSASKLEFKKNPLIANFSTEFAFKTFESPLN